MNRYVMMKIQKSAMIFYGTSKKLDNAIYNLGGINKEFGKIKLETRS